MKNQAFYWETRAALEAVNELRFDDLRAMLDDAYGTVDVDATGHLKLVSSKAQWESNLARLEGLENTQVDSEILEYQGIQSGNLGYSVVRFSQTAQWSDGLLSSCCVATLVWRCGEEGWKLLHWHASQEHPDTLPQHEYVAEPVAA